MVLSKSNIQKLVSQHTRGRYTFQPLWVSGPTQYLHQIRITFTNSQLRVQFINVPQIFRSYCVYYTNTHTQSNCLNNCLCPEMHVTGCRSFPSQSGVCVYGDPACSLRVQLQANLVPRSHSVTGNVRSGKVREYTIFHWLLKKGCGNAIYAPIGLFRGALSEGVIFASSCAVLNKCQLCGGKFCFFPTPEKLYS